MNKHGRNVERRSMMERTYLVEWLEKHNAPHEYQFAAQLQLLAALIPTLDDIHLSEEDKQLCQQLVDVLTALQRDVDDARG